jgi:CheY-like chemotaxis protein
VVEARHGADALRQLQSAPSGIDLVITDVVMPEMGGRELGRRLKQMRPSLPVLFMSGYTGDDVIQRGLMDAGAPFQQKPFAPDGLARKVREMLDQARARLQNI